MWKNSDFWRRLLILERPRSTLPVEPGLYHAMYEHDGAYQRFHLRVDNDGSGLLLANATAAARLSPTGALMARKLLDGVDDGAVHQAVKEAFRDVEDIQIEEDLSMLRQLFQQLANPGDVFPVLVYNDVDFSPYTAQLIAPLRATLPLGTSAQMEALLSRLWQIGVPHCVILAPDAPNVAALVRAVEIAEDLGMIAGLRGLASSLHRSDQLRDLALAGVDYVILPYATSDAEPHDALYGAGDHAAATEAFATLQEYEVCPVAELPLVAETVNQFDATLAALANQGVENCELFALLDEPGHSDQTSSSVVPGAVLQLASDLDTYSYEMTVRTVWLPLTLRDTRLSVAQQLQRGPRCFGFAPICVLPDGTIVPPRGDYRGVGNLLHDDWQTIWQHPAFREYRESVAVPDETIDSVNLGQIAIDDTAREGQ